MKNVAACIILSLSLCAAFAQSSFAADAMMKKHGMKHDGMMKHDTMMKHDGMMKHDSMKKSDAMQKDHSAQ